MPTHFLTAIVLLCILIGGYVYAKTRKPSPKQPQVKAETAVAQTTVAIIAPVPGTGTPTFTEDFSSGALNTTKWLVAQWKSADSKPGINAGSYIPSELDFSAGLLRISIDQTPDATLGMVSKGGAVQSKQKFGFGTFTFEMRMSSLSAIADGAGATVTGGVSSAFLYLPNSLSEIDLEFLGNDNAMWGTNWTNPDPTQPPNSTMKSSQKFPNADLATGFHTYQLVWTANAVAWYIDGQLVGCHTDHVPQAPAYIILQHRGTNSNLWGGVATPGVRRYAYFKKVSFVPAI